MAKDSLTTGKFTFNSVEYGVTSLEISRQADEIDVTDTATTGDGKEYLGGRVGRTFTVEMWRDTTVAAPPLNAEHAGIIDFEGLQYSGQMIILSISTQASIDNAIKETVTGRINGAVTETLVV